MGSMMCMTSPTQTMTLTEARNRLLEIAERFERDPTAAIEVTKRGKRVMILIPATSFEALVETLDILSDEEALSRLRKAVDEVDRGEVVSWDRVRRGLTE